MKCAIITLTGSSVSTDHFNLYADDDGLGVPNTIFATDVNRNDLIMGYNTNQIPDAATVIRVKSNTTFCTNYVDVNLVIPTPTPSTTPSVSISSTPAVSTSVTPTVTPTMTPTPSCARPSGLSVFSLYRAYDNGSGYNSFIDSFTESCDLLIIHNTVNNGYTWYGTPHMALSLSVGETIYNGVTTSCLKSATGYYHYDNGGIYEIVYILNGIIDSFPTCLGVTPTPTVTPTMTPAITPSVTPSITITPTPTTSCQRPDGLSNLSYFNTSLDYPSFSTSLSLACAALAAWPLDEIAGGTLKVMDTSLPPGEKTYTFVGTDCDTSHFTGWPIIISGGTPYILHLTDGYVTEFPVICSAPTPTPTISVSPSVTPSRTPSITPSRTPSISVSPSVTPTRTPTVTPSRTPSRTPSVTPTRTPSVTPTHTPSVTPTHTPTPTTSPEAKDCQLFTLDNTYGIEPILFSWFDCTGVFHEQTVPAGGHTNNQVCVDILQPHHAEAAGDFIGLGDPCST